VELIRFHNAIIGNRKNNPVITECIIKDGNKIASGIALCSKMDKFNEVTGINLARRRALRKIKGRKVRPMARHKAISIFMETGYPIPADGAKALNLNRQCLSKVCKIEKEALFKV